MIRFFRRIRQQLLSQNKFSKYLLYAIGEIILVVLGILIALQINNWNQQRLNKKLEITMLKEIKSSLESDQKFLEGFKFREKIRKEGIQELLAMIASKQTYADSTLLKTYNKMAILNTYDYNEGGYEGLKSIGLDKISNDSVRRELIQIYEIAFPEILSFFEKVDQANRNGSYKLQLHNALWKRIQIQLPDKSYKIISRPINNASFLSQPELIDRLKIEQDNINFVNFRMPHLEYTIQKGLELVNNELRKLEGQNEDSQ